MLAATQLHVGLLVHAWYCLCAAAQFLTTLAATCLSLRWTSCGRLVCFRCTVFTSWLFGTHFWRQSLGKARCLQALLGSTLATSSGFGLLQRRCDNCMGQACALHLALLQRSTTPLHTFAVGGSVDLLYMVFGCCSLDSTAITMVCFVIHLEGFFTLAATQLHVGLPVHAWYCFRAAAQF